MNFIHLLSGGLDSVCVLYTLAKTHPDDRIIAVSFDYGQRNSKEISVAKYFAKKLKIKFFRYKINFLYQGNYCPYLSRKFFKSDLSRSKDLKEFNCPKNTTQAIPNYVPNRNGIFFEMAAALGLQFFKNEEFFISHGLFLEDSIKYKGHPDGDRVYLNLLNKSIERSSRGIAHILINDLTTKSEILKEAVINGFTLEDSLKTRSCMNSHRKECGICSSCFSKRKSIIDVFNLAIEDAAKIFKENKITLLEYYYSNLFNLP